VCSSDLKSPKYLLSNKLIKVDFFALIKADFRRLILRYVLGGAWVICVLI
jgi:hypothetical protein